MRTCEEYVIDKLEFTENRMHYWEDAYVSMKAMYDCRRKDIEFLLKFFKKTTSGGHQYYTMRDLVTEEYDNIDFNEITALIEMYGKEEPIES